MPSPLVLEDFSLFRIADPDVAVHLNTESEATQLAAFDKGYSEGWEDATRAAKDEVARNGETVMGTLTDLGFTFHEARTHVMGALSPLVRGLMTALLPRLVDDTLGQRLEQEIMELAGEMSEAPVALLASPGDAEHLREIVDAITGLPIVLVEEETVDDGQIFLRLGDTETEIDLTGAFDRMTEALDALEDLNRETKEYG